MTAKHPKRKERPGVDRAGRTPLHYAAADADVQQVRQLLATGLIAAASDDDGWTPLHFAAQSNSADVATILLDAGAPVDTTDSSGNTPLWKAVFNSQGDGKLIKLLRARGADPHTKNKHGVSPLKLARTIANYDVRQFFDDLPEESDG
jgi:ankyrin repeat protein